MTAAVSLLVHGAALAWVISVEKPEPLPVVAAPVITVEDTLTIVELLPDPVVAPPVVVPQRGGGTTVAADGTPRPGRAAISTGARGTTETAPVTIQPVEPPAAPPEKPPQRRLGMRTGPQLTTVAEQLATLALAYPDSRPLPDYPGQRSRQALEVAKAHGDLEGIVAAREAIAAEELKAQKDGTFTSDKTTFVAKVDKDGRVSFKDKANLNVKGFHGTFDATDWAMRAQGMDPYAAEKLAYLDRTRDQRVEIGKAHRKQQLRQSAGLMQASLDRVWQSTRDAAARKQAIFELWDECAESGEPELVEAAAEARALLVRFVHVKLPAEARFTADELARLNAKRRSKTAFDPYR
ncbi:MAG: hypothetical protein H0T46_28210 [Deltaproteobacteria bacterium]|nr:hypothetical protein [Deltaproteobacteria bacterium]